MQDKIFNLLSIIFIVAVFGYAVIGWILGY